jgi:hypothetical protein
MSVKFLYKTVNFIVFFVLLLLKSILIFSNKRNLPKIIILSLTKNQFNYRNKEDFLAFIHEDRFGFNLSNEPVLLEVRHLFPHKISKGNNNPIVTRDLFLYLVLYHIEFRKFANLYRELSSNIDLVNQNKFNITYYKQNIFDVSVWNIVLRQIKSTTFLVTTQTHMLSLPIVFKIQNKIIKKVMMWYSTNSVPIHKADDLQLDKWLEKDIVDYIDEHFVWNSGQALDLKKQGVINCKIVGSILFSTRKLTKVQENFITYFDVTPLENADTIYSVDSCVLALTDVTNSILELNEKFNACFILRVKPKRSYSRFHSSYYISTLKKLHNEGKLQIVDWNENLYTCISGSRAILSVPYSSPIEIGNEIGIPGAYYFDGDTEWKIGLDQKKMSPLFTNKNQLKSWLEKTVYSGHKQTS